MAMISAVDAAASSSTAFAVPHGGARSSWSGAKALDKSLREPRALPQQAAAAPRSEATQLLGDSYAVGMGGASATLVAALGRRHRRRARRQHTRQVKRCAPRACVLEDDEDDEDFSMAPWADAVDARPIIVLSDYSGQGCRRLAERAWLQFGSSASAQFHMCPNVKDIDGINLVIAQALAAKDASDDAQAALVVYTLADRELNRHLVSECARLGIPCVDVIDKLLAAMEKHFSQPRQTGSGATSPAGNEGTARPIIVASDATGDSPLNLLRSALLQFPGCGLESVQVCGGVRTLEEVRLVVQEAVRKQALIVFTGACPGMTRFLRQQCEAAGLSSIEMYQPLVSAFRSYLTYPPFGIPGGLDLEGGPISPLQFEVLKIAGEMTADGDEKDTSGAGSAAADTAKRRILAVSDHSGSGAKRLAERALSQFVLPEGAPIELRPQVRSQEDAMSVVADARGSAGSDGGGEAPPALVVYTMASKETSEYIAYECDRAGVPSVNMLEPLLQELEEQLAQLRFSSKARSGGGEEAGGSTDSSAPTILLVSDSSCGSSVNMVQSALLQFPRAGVEEVVVCRDVRSLEEVNLVLRQAEESGALVVFTFASLGMSRFMRQQCEEASLRYVDLYQPLLTLLEDYFEMPAYGIAGGLQSDALAATKMLWEMQDVSNGDD
eukprot:TRINITY_DN80945_c0_g1_i1.p1 TRINITY_DN80945_c0_g1~~TRINITY_DN80945_c0_g1_i1.p1  ORF type:complete len:701 (+),score=130.66 TRINITY_DN80945_c0_g1_i1:103-2103(+)